MTSTSPLSSEDECGAAPEILPVTVVIPTWRRPQWLANGLARISRLAPKPAEILVIGRDDDHETRAVVAQFAPVVTWHSVSDPGYVAPVRVATRAVATPYVAFLDDDAEPINDDWLGRLYEHVGVDRVACVGSRVVESVGLDAPARRSAGRLSWFGRIGGNTGRRRDRTPVDVVALPEGNWIWRVDVLRRLEIPPIFDNGDASMYGCDLCLQARRIGWRTIYVGEAPILHHSAPRSDSAVRRTDRATATFGYTRNMTFIALRHFGWRLPFFAIWSTLIGDSAFLGFFSAAREGARGQVSRSLASASLRGRRDGVRRWFEQRRSDRAR